MLGRRSLLLAAPALVAYSAIPAAADRKIVVTQADTLDEAERQRHERYMQMAVDVIDGGPPFGALIVDHTNGNVMCHGSNRGSRNRIYHGEMDAMITCGEEHPEIDWTGLTLYTTGEPCPMCMSAVVWNRIPRVVYATSIEKLKEIGLNQIGLSAPTVAAAAPFYDGEIVTGVLAERTDAMFENWRASR